MNCHTILYENSDRWQAILSMLYDKILYEYYYNWNLVPRALIVCSNNGQTVLGQCSTQYSEWSILLIPLI